MTPNKLARLSWACFAIGALPIVGLIAAEVVEAMAFVWGYQLKTTPPTLGLLLRYWLTAVFWYALWLLMWSALLAASQRRQAARRPSWVERFKDLCPSRSEKVAAAAAMSGIAVLATAVIVGLVELLSLAWGYSLPLGPDIIRVRIFVVAGFWTVGWLLVGAGIQCRRLHGAGVAKRRATDYSVPETKAST